MLYMYWKKSTVSKADHVAYHAAGWLPGRVESSISDLEFPTVDNSTIVYFESHLIARLGLPPQPSCPWPPCQLRPPHRVPPARCQRVAVAASAEGCGAGTTGGAPSTTRQGATVATCRTAACRDASVAVTTNGAAQTAEPRDDHVAGLVAPLHWSNVDIV
jgi:hypothetical protein